MRLVSCFSSWLIFIEVGNTCDVLSLARVDFTLGNAVKCRGISRMDWADVQGFWGNDFVC